MSVLTSQGADGVRGLKGNKGEKVGALRLLDWKSKKVAVWEKKTFFFWETQVFVQIILRLMQWMMMVRVVLRAMFHTNDNDFAEIL